MNNLFYITGKLFFDFLKINSDDSFPLKIETEPNKVDINKLRENLFPTLNLSTIKPKVTIFDYIPSCLKANQKVTFDNQFFKFKCEQ